MVFITHDLSEALKLGDRILIMRDGEHGPDRHRRRARRRAGRRLRGATSCATCRARERADAALDHARRRRPATSWTARSWARTSSSARRPARCSAAERPVKVVENGELLGVVGDEEILEVIAAQELEVTRQAANPTGRRSPSPPPAGGGREPEAARKPVDDRRSRAARARAGLGPPAARPVRGPRRWLAVVCDPRGLARAVRGLPRPRPRSSWRPPSSPRCTGWFNDVNDTDRRQPQHQPASSSTSSTRSGSSSTTSCTGFQYLISQPVPGRGVPLIGWLGVVAIAGYVVLGRPATSGSRSSRSRASCSSACRGCGRRAWTRWRCTAAAVLVALVIGIPLGIWAGMSPRVNRIITPVLDFMQTMPTFVYLAPLTLFFLIGPASATIATLIYAMPPAIRHHRARHRARCRRARREAADSLGATRGQTLVKVLLPMAQAHDRASASTRRSWPRSRWSRSPR